MTTSNQPHSPNDFQVKLFLQLIFLFIAIMIGCQFFASCKAKPVENTHTVERVIERQTDSIKVSETNKAIFDSLMVHIEKVKTTKPECDSITQATLDNVLSQLNSRKKSGDNEVGIYYDELKKMIIAYSKIAETKNEKTAVTKAESITATDNKTTEVQVKYIPWWVKYLAWLGVAFLIFLGWRISKIWL